VIVLVAIACGACLLIGCALGIVIANAAHARRRGGYIDVAHVSYSSSMAGPVFGTLSSSTYTGGGNEAA
jgi:hypothetical protein